MVQPEDRSAEPVHRCTVRAPEPDPDPNPLCVNIEECGSGPDIHLPQYPQPAGHRHRHILAVLNPSPNSSSPPLDHSAPAVTSRPPAVGSAADLRLLPHLRASPAAVLRPPRPYTLLCAPSTTLWSLHRPSIVAPLLPSPPPHPGSTSPAPTVPIIRAPLQLSVSMASRVFSKVSPAVGRILWGEKWSSTIASSTQPSSSPPLRRPLHPRLGFCGQVRQKICHSSGSFLYGEKWIWRQPFFVPLKSSDVKRGIFQVKAERHFKSLLSDPAAIRDSVQGKVDEFKKYGKLFEDTGMLFVNPLKLAAMALSSTVIIKTSLTELNVPGSTLKHLGNLASPYGPQAVRQQNPGSVCESSGSGKVPRATVRDPVAGQSGQ